MYMIINCTLLHRTKSLSWRMINLQDLPFCLWAANPNMEQVLLFIIQVVKRWADLLCDVQTVVICVS